MKKLFFISSLFSFLIVGCTNDVDTEASDTPNLVTQDSTASSDYDGFQLMQSSCFSCHSPDPSIENPVAPSLLTIKKAYLTAYDDQQTFEEAIISFLANPLAENGIMKEAIATYGLMPQMSLGTDKSAAIASYLYMEKIESDEWFLQRYQSEQRRVKLLSDNLSDIDRGFEFAKGTKSILGKNLKAKLKNDGPIGALEFCNLRAYHFTDSMSQVYDAEIRRVSDKARNPNNKADERELEIIELFKNQLSSGGEIQPVTKAFMEGYVHGYYPIVTNDMCMKCHGDIDQMQEGLHDRITALYPEDLATGYKPIELRGIWVVKMKKRDQN